jgi:formate dehydrogenase subunit gamma
MSARLVGLIAALLVGAAFIATAIAWRGPASIVLPTNGVTAGGKSDNPAGTAAQTELQVRTKMQRWPGETAQPAPSTHALAPAASGPLSAGDQRIQEWLADKGANRDILDQPRNWKGIASLPDPERGVLMQPEGRTWRHIHNETLFYGGATYVFGVSLLIAVFLAVRGRISIADGESGETVKRFSAFERANHWLTALSFLMMALTGLVILYGNAAIRPWLGAQLYAPLARASAWSHMTFAVPFVLGVLAMMALWTRQNLWERLDWHWLRHGGGFFRKDGNNPPARKFNVGQKLVFWSVVLGGLSLTATGVGLMFPFLWAGYTGMQIAQTLHAAIALLMIGVIIGHIYIGTIGMEGAFAAMWSGWVDRNWAKEHHSLWYSGEAGEKKPAVVPITSTRRKHLSAAAIGSFAAGVIVAIALAVVMTGVFGSASISTAERAAISNPSVHLDSSEARERTVRSSTDLRP